MALSSGTSGASLLDEDMKARLEQRKRRRMDSNRESARRSRMRKRKQLHDLTEEVSRLQNEHKEALVALATVNQHRLAVDAENRVLRTQQGELSSRLQALLELAAFAHGVGWSSSPAGMDLLAPNGFGSGFGFDMSPCPWSASLHPLTASADLFQCL